MRRFRAADAPALQAVLGSAEGMRHSDTGPLKPPAVARWLTEAMRPAPAARGFWAVLDPAGDCVGYAHLTQEPGRTAPDAVEIGLRLARAAQRRGIGRAVVAALCARAAEEGGCTRVLAFVDPGNTPSLRLFARAGFDPAGSIMLPGYDHPDLILARDLLSSSER
ncbi:MAG: GNAT family N-acetyltransferase [Gemmobacter sp.]